MIGERIKQLRQKKSYSITELARLADVSKSYLSQIERGLQSNPSMQFLKKISIPLDTSLDYLLLDGDPQGKFEAKLDDEWMVLFQQAMENGLKKEEFKEYLNYIKFQSWLKEQNKT
ncbi:helix-turn-helix domain-containing protein [Neobacillus sp. MM2021_6]|uniref:helix-turn-helix domain-containing protein n=1 Tax=Bacillaceae TaxID=186817 RepID=UPI001409467A|nr:MULTISPECIES: helix-turn-helix domain-containing protein [Bacillaceae]MBO0958277.1 helix-turn-helix domain-containing protein [Neobacillus sp. MM2021_6]NHC17877.1 helix-turn-helix domain-containing protein [Bacillus sp. MM2020_4]